MQTKMESLVKKVYKEWKAQQKTEAQHPDEQALACFLQGSLPSRQRERLKAHVISCERCAHILVTSLEVADDELRSVPVGLVTWAKAVIAAQQQESLVEICLRFKDKAWEIIKVNGDILMGGELLPQPVLRSRDIKELKDEVVVVKDCADKQVEIRIESKTKGYFTLRITVRSKRSHRMLKGLRMTLLKDDTELDSYVAENGSVTFEHVTKGKYTVVIADVKSRIVSILVDINV